MALVEITTSGSGNCKGIGLCCKWASCSSWSKEERENEHMQINGWENGKHLACHSEWHGISTAVGSGHWYKNWPYLIRTWPYGLSHVESTTRKELAAECQLTYQELKILTCGQYPNITPRNKRSELGEGQTWKNKYVNQGGPIRNTKTNVPSYLPP